MKGDIIEFDNEQLFYDMNLGSIVKILNTKKYEDLEEYIGCYVMRCNERESDNSYGVTIYHPDGYDIGEFWGNLFDKLSWEIIKEV